ncbi:MAG: sigma-54-dependent transcriptional regulator [Candidatus Aminicenantales bacterium]
MKFKILIIDDEQGIRDIFSLLLRDNGYLVETAATADDGAAGIRTFEPDLVLLDMNLPDGSGLDVLNGLRPFPAGPRIVILTAFGTIRNAVEATKLGAYAYLEKPVDNEELLLVIDRALEVKKLAAEVDGLKSELQDRYRFTSMVGTSGRMNSIFRMMERIARVDGTVLITGESGTGKELAARAIHFAGPRKDGPFVVVNCGAIPPGLIESEFFGHSRGAYTDARTETTGQFERAHNGTIFLDEIGELPLAAQVKLLRAVAEKEIVKVGGSKTIPVDVRVIAATNKSLNEEISKGAFREDLYYRLAVLSLQLPPLRERREDIPLLCEHFFRKFRSELKIEIQGITEGALDLLLKYSWPGNVRELENVIYEAVVMSGKPLLAEGDLPGRIRGVVSTGGDTLKEAAQSAAEAAEKSLIEKALLESDGNKTEAARILGISRKTLFNKIKSFRMDG